MEPMDTKTPERVERIRRLGEDLLRLIDERSLPIADSVSALTSVVVVLAEREGLPAAQVLDFMGYAVTERLN